MNSDITKAAKLDKEYADIVGVHGRKFVPTTSRKRTNLQFLLTWDDNKDPKWYPWNSTLGDDEMIPRRTSNAHVYSTEIYISERSSQGNCSAIETQKRKTKTKQQ